MTTRHMHSLNQPHLRSAQRGLTILELLISMVLGVALMAGVAEVFVGMRQTDRTQEVNSRMQEAGRFAMNFLSQDLRTAGYMGCASTRIEDINVLLTPPLPGSFQPATGIQGWEADDTGLGQINNLTADVAVVSVTDANPDWSTSGGNSIAATNAVPDSDLMRIWGADNGVTPGEMLLFTEAVTPAMDVSAMGLSNGDIVMVSDCEFIDIAQACSVTNVAGPPAKQTLSLSAGCSPGTAPSSRINAGNGAEVNKLAGTLYYVGKRGNVATNPPALFRRTLNTTGTLGTPEELVEGVESIQLLYGENTNNDFRNAADRYVPAHQVTDWAKVVSVRISILVRSLDDNLVPAAQPYTFNGVTYDGVAGNGALPPDRRLRRVFTTTVNLRNRALGG